MLESRITIAVILAVLGLATLAWVLHRRWQLQLAVREQFRAFREQAVVLMDRLDALRQRHRTMTSTDPDFEVPMAGATRSYYDHVSQELERLWERWLRVMEVWNEAQGRLAAGSGLTAGPVEEARLLLEGGELETLVRETGACEQRLEWLNQAHERARSELQAARHELAAAQNAVTGGTGVLLPSDRHHEVLQESEHILADADARIAADPIGSAELILQTRERLAALTELPRPSHDWSIRSLADQPVFAEVAAAAERLRAAASRLWSGGLLGGFARAWLAVMGLCFLLLLLLPLAPLALFLVVGLTMMGFFWLIVRAQFAWFWRVASGSLDSGGSPRRWPRGGPPARGR